MDSAGSEKFVSYHSRRLRFVEYIPQSIHSISFSESGDQLALSRGDGNLELWVNCDGSFQKKLRIPGKSDRCVETISWCGDRLFTGCLLGNIEEWDLIRLQPYHSQNLDSGPIWCLKSNLSKMLIAAGCENGKVYIIRASNCDESVFQLSSIYGQEKSRILSLAWSPNNQFLVIGTSNGLIKKINVSNGSSELTISCEKVPNCIIWDLLYIESSIISSDSLGRVQVWSDEYGTLLFSFKEHNLDVLCIATTQLNNVLFSTGVDQKIVCYQKVKESGEWIKKSHLKSHTHDVRAMDLSCTGFLATGGIDTNLNIVHIDHFNARGVKKYSMFQDSANFFSIDSCAQFIVQQTNMAIKVWRVSQDDYFSPHNILDVKSNDFSYILSTAVASNGSKMAVSTVNKLFLYGLDRSFLQFKCLLELAVPSYKMEFSDDGLSLLLATITKGICLMNTQGKKYEEIIPVEKIYYLLPIISLSANKNCSYFVITGFNNETVLYSSDNGTVVYKFPLVNTHIPLHSFTPSDALIIYLSGKILKYDISRNEIVEVGIVKTSSFLPKDVCVLDERFAALQYSEGMSVFQYMAESKNQVICSNRWKLSGILLAMSVCSDGVIVMIEQTSSKSIKTLPPVLKKEHYGT